MENFSLGGSCTCGSWITVSWQWYHWLSSTLSHLASLLNKFFVEKSWVSRTPIPASQSLLVKPFPKYLKFLLHLKIHKILGLFLKNAYPCLCLLFTMFEMKQLLMLDIFLVSFRVWQPQYFKINMKKMCVD